MATATRTIHVPYPAADDLRLGIRAGACRLQITPGTNHIWLSGTYEDPTGEVPCRVHRRGGFVRIRQPEEVSLAELLLGMPSASLKLGRARPCALTIEEAAAECALDLGGVPLQEVTIEGTAGEIDLDFSAPNPRPMRLLDLDTGAARVRARRLANACFAELCLGGHADAYALDFGGELRHPAQANICIGRQSALEIAAPATTAIHVLVGNGTRAVDADAGWTRTDDGYRNTAAITGKSPLLTVDTGLSAGSLRLRTSTP